MVILLLENILAKNFLTEEIKSFQVFILSPLSDPRIDQRVNEVNHQIDQNDHKR